MAQLFLPANRNFTGGPGFEQCLLVELNEKENLADSTVNTAALKGNGYQINIVTKLSSSEQESFVSRIFAPEVLTSGEDPVSGAVHCVLGPYWSDKQGIPAGKEITATQVSSRGGQIKLV
ncbi:hypothetical protein BDQ17DRAFT_1328338 [Cyathus striatus]|nr:hypothetical protein BDQ17DRAFT_1328338 [Cyathus striatus]